MRNVSSTIHLDRSQVHLGWSKDHQPLVSVASGSELTLETQDASDGQLSRASTVADLANLDSTRVNSVTGPVFAEGARRADVLQIELLSVEPGSWGWTAQIPGFGLLADQFPDPWLHVWQLDRRSAPFMDGIKRTNRAFCGVIGVAPAEPGVHSHPTSARRREFGYQTAWRRNDLVLAGRSGGRVAR